MLAPPARQKVACIGGRNRFLKSLKYHRRLRIRNTVQCASHCRFQLQVYWTRSLLITLTQIIKTGMRGQYSRVPNYYPCHFPGVNCVSFTLYNPKHVRKGLNVYAPYVLILFDSGPSDFLFCLAVFQRPNQKGDKVDSRIGLKALSSEMDPAEIRLIR